MWSFELFSFQYGDVLESREAQGEAERPGELSEHTHLLIKLAVLSGLGFMGSKTIMTATSEITDYKSKVIIARMFEMARIIQNGTQR